ncbi:hypothetical protein NBRC116495_15960 [Aurantivibrio plasticivorans]
MRPGAVRMDQSPNYKRHPSMGIEDLSYILAMGGQPCLAAAQSAWHIVDKCDVYHNLCCATLAR